MRVYYLFVIKKELYETYKKHESTLYKTLEKLYFSSLEEYNYALVIYYQLCEIIKVTHLSLYFEEKEFFKTKEGYEFRNRETKEHTYIQITPSYIKIKTNKNYSELFRICLYYNSNILYVILKKKIIFGSNLVVWDPL